MHMCVYIYIYIHICVASRSCLIGRCRELTCDTACTTGCARRPSVRVRQMARAQDARWCERKTQIITPNLPTNIIPTHTA